MKAIFSCAAVLLMAVVLYGGDYFMDVYTNTGKVTYYDILSIDSVKFRAWVPGDTLVDRRDGQKYATVLIGTQCWMAENLNVGTRINGSLNQANNSVIEKYAYADNDSNTDVYGGLYQWNEMMQYSTTEGVQGICPDGWHVPTDAEWTVLVNAVGGQATAWTALKAGGVSGFEGLLSGMRYYDGTFFGLGPQTYFWCSSPVDALPAWAWCRYMDSGSSSVDGYNEYMTNGFCVRCVRD